MVNREIARNGGRCAYRLQEPRAPAQDRWRATGNGIFHAVCWLAVLTGLALLYSRVTHDRRRVWVSRVLWGWILVGWGLFDLVEGLLDHQILGIHHVHGGPYQLCRTAPEIRYDVGTVHYEEFPGPRVVPPAWSPPTLGWWLGP